MMFKTKLFKITIFCLIPFICFSSIYFHLRHSDPPPLVSVVMPVYNRPDLVGRAITSILNQTMDNFELIIVDDGSDTLTKSILKQYAKQDDRIRLIYNPKNQGIAYSRQRGADAARGEYIAVMDSDDWSVPDRLEKSLAFMRDHPEVDAMTGGIQAIPKDVFIPDYSVSEKKGYTVDKLPGFYEVEQTFANLFWNVSALYKRSFTLKNKIRYNDRLLSAEDYDFWRQFVLFGGRMASIKDTLAYVRFHSSNSKEYYTAMSKNALDVKRKMLSQFFLCKDEDVKYVYSQKEKCALLRKMLDGNLKNPKLPHHYLENRFAAQCPVDFETALYLKHPFWSDFLVELKDGKWQRLRTKDKGQVVIEDDKITIVWDSWPKETFYLQNDGSYQFYPEGEKIRLEHPYWSDSIIVPTKRQKTCRFSLPDVCAIVNKVSKDKVIVEWENQQWNPEVFQRNQNGIYKFIQEMPRK